MLITFDSALVLESRVGTSKSGNPYCQFKVLDESDLSVYDLMQFGESAVVASGLSKGSRVRLDFECSPAREGGVRFNLVGVGHIA